jgi:hypothetical protein
MFLMLFAACEGDERVDLNTGSAYFPLQTGAFQVYRVEETHYSASEDPLETSYELMAEVVDSFPSGEEQVTFVIHRSVRANDSEDWGAFDTWSVRKDRNGVVVSEGNTPYVKMKFPLTTENAWDGNAFNTLGEDEYRLTGFGQPFELDGLEFRNTITIEQEYNDDRIVFRDERKEIYAYDAGLVYKELIQLNYCTGDACLGQQRIDHGLEMKMVIRDYGKR